MDDIVKELHDTLSFTDEVVSKNLSIEKDSFCEMIEFSNKFNEIYDKVTPYHLFLLELIRSGEREIDHSRMLQQLLFCRSNGEYPILKSFFKELNLNLTIKDPQITAETKRIDILILDGKNYAIIIENKINGASDQPNQLANYINKIRYKEGYESKDIYVVYLPKEDGREPDVQSWINPEGNKSYYDEFEERFRVFSIKNKLLQWLENDVLELIENDVLELSNNARNRYLRSTLEQYIYILKTI
jgi:hypothetical protein